MLTEDLHRGRGWARVGFWTGVGASVAANIAHAFVGSGTPSWLMLLFATLPPFALLVGIEVIAQVRWRPVWYQYVIRWGAVGSVAAIGGVVSYDHMRMALIAHGESGIGAALLPVLVDGLMTVCSAALLTIGDNVRRAERVAKLPADREAEVSALHQRAAEAEERAETERARAELLAAEATRLRKRLNELPAETSARRPAAKAAAAKATSAKKATPYRPTEETRALAAAALAADPAPTRKEVAEELGITDRRLRGVLNEPTGEQQIVIPPAAEVSAPELAEVSV